MKTEIEAKLKVKSLSNAEKRLSKAGAVFIEKQTHRDCYFDDKNHRLKKTDCCLRLRILKVGKTKTFFLTYKGAKQKDNYKKRTEIELRVNDIVSARKMLKLLGYRQRLVVEKKRSLWQLDGCLVSLDFIERLGFFVEIEGPDDRRINRVQKKIGLSRLKHIPKSYACLIEERKLK
jgi:predicted adenylyl cyclase CyaB